MGGPGYKQYARAISNYGAFTQNGFRKEIPHLLSLERTLYFMVSKLLFFFILKNIMLGRKRRYVL